MIRTIDIDDLVCVWPTNDCICRFQRQIVTQHDDKPLHVPMPKQLSVWKYAATGWRPISHHVIQAAPSVCLEISVYVVNDIMEGYHLYSPGLSTGGFICALFHRACLWEQTVGDWMQQNEGIVTRRNSGIQNQWDWILLIQFSKSAICLWIPDCHGLNERYGFKCISVN